jgi:putative peptidoglycan lipid II flippase
MASTTVKPPGGPAAPPPGGGKKPLGIAGATALMMVMVLLSRILGVLRDAIIAKYFGRSPLTDAYQAAFTVPDLLFYLLQSGALSSTVVPILTEYRQQGKGKSADKLVSIVASVIFVFIGLLICLMWINARALTIALNLGFDEHTVDLSVPLTRVLLPAQMFFFLGGLMMGVLYSRKQFLIPALGPVIYNAGIIFGGVVLRHWLGIHGLVWGAIGGAFLGNFLIPLLAVLRLGVRIRPSFDVTHPAAMQVWRMLLPIGLGVSLPNIDQMVNKEFASFLGKGDTTAIMAAYRLMLLPIGVFAQAMALAAFPTLSAQAAEKNITAMRRTMNQSLRNILFLTVPASALMFLLAEPVVTFLLQSGKFTHADSLVTASALRSLSLGIFAWSCQSLLTRGFYALQNSKVPVISGAIVSVIFVAMNVWVVRPVIRVKARVDTLSHQVEALQANVALVQPFVAPSQAALSAVTAAQSSLVDAAPAGGANDAALSLGAAEDQLTQLVAQAQTTLTDVQARLDTKQAQLAEARSELDARASRAVWELGLTTTIAATIHMIALYFLLRHRLTGLQSRRLVSSLGKTLMATLALCALTKLILAVCETGFETSHLAPKLTAAITLSLAGLAGIGAFLGTARALRMGELQSAVDLIRRKRK